MRCREPKGHRSHFYGFEFWVVTYRRNPRLLYAIHSQGKIDRLGSLLKDQNANKTIKTKVGRGGASLSFLQVENWVVSYWHNPRLSNSTGSQGKISHLESVLKDQKAIKTSVLLISKLTFGTDAPLVPDPSHSLPPNRSQGLSKWSQIYLCNTT